MPVGFRWVKNHVRADRALVDRFAAVPVAIVSDNMNRMFAGGADLRPMHACEGGSGGLAGAALTVLTRPGDNLVIHKAIDVAEPGDVIVVDAGGDTTSAVVGELIARHAQVRGVAGFVINGAIRDLDAFRGGNFPIFATGVTHRGPYKDGPGEIGVPLSIGGMVVHSGDIVIGDADGVLAVPRAEAGSIIELAEAQQAKEAEILRQIEAGTWDRRWVDEMLKARGFTEE
ncbi:RraA family protein [Oceanibaculum indicum]|uniref:Putative 4-hydroxy-4-methyl-2-oxoglutarate aldolase n=1 Tax=Oceanibaculum indicum TaxID=526216 RepID=A0A420WPE4_9PROT|nr:RraA family protein [Oceanibaculum indicum]RKQ72879.1 regulator of RNase E activity RraA [Oceanibaculum indicum]